MLTRPCAVCGTHNKKARTNRCAKHAKKRSEISLANLGVPKADRFMDLPAAEIERILNRLYASRRLRRWEAR